MKSFKKLNLVLIGVLISMCACAQNFSPDIVVDIDGSGDNMSLHGANDGFIKFKIK